MYINNLIEYLPSLGIFAVFFVGFCFLYRLYKNVGRRCRKKGCGSIHVKSVHKIYLGEGETFSLFGPNRKLRWWIRRVLCLSFRKCPRCGHTELVKTSTGPISLAHIWWAKLRYPEQFRDDGNLYTVADFALRDLLNRKTLREHGEHAVICDDPPIHVEL
jgi:hypothetical protein